jgi:hypothetical protein
VRFEVAAAYAFGLLLPVLETCRRGIGHWAVSTMTMLEDYAGGGLLLLAAVLSTRRSAAAPLWMLGAWSGVTAMMAISFLYHFEETVRGDATEPRNTVVLAIKALLLAASLAALVLSFRRARDRVADKSG